MLMVCPCSPRYITVCGNKNIIPLHLAVQLVNYIALPIKKNKKKSQLYSFTVFGPFSYTHV